MILDVYVCKLEPVPVEQPRIFVADRVPRCDHRCKRQATRHIHHPALLAVATSKFPFFVHLLGGCAVESGLFHPRYDYRAAYFVLQHGNQSGIRNFR